MSGNTARDAIKEKEKVNAFLYFVINIDIVSFFLFFFYLPLFKNNNSFIDFYKTINKNILFIFFFLFFLHYYYNFLKVCKNSSNQKKRKIKH